MSRPAVQRSNQRWRGPMWRIMQQTVGKVKSQRTPSAFWLTMMIFTLNAMTFNSVNKLLVDDVMWWMFTNWMIQFELAATAFIGACIKHSYTRRRDATRDTFKKSLILSWCELVWFTSSGTNSTIIISRLIICTLIGGNTASGLCVACTHTPSLLKCITFVFNSFSLLDYVVFSSHYN